MRTVSRHGYQFVFPDVTEQAGRGRPRPPLGGARRRRSAAAPADEPDPYEDPLSRLLVTEPVAAGEEGEAERREAAEALHALGTEEALRRLDQRPGHASARALLRDTRWDVPGAGLVPLLGAPGGPGRRAHPRAHAAARAPCAWPGAAGRARPRAARWPGWSGARSAASPWCWPRAPAPTPA